MRGGKKLRNLRRITDRKWTDGLRTYDFALTEDRTANVVYESVSLEQLKLRELSTDPPDPPEGEAVIWMSNGDDSGADGDIMMKITAAGSTKTITLVDFSIMT